MMREEIIAVYPWAQGIYGEVWDYDVYRFRELPDTVHETGHSKLCLIEPDTVIDLGANVGVFTSYARSLYPSAKIVAVEPDKENFRMLLSHKDDNMTMVNAAIASGQVYRTLTSENGGMHCYLSQNPGHTQEDFDRLVAAQRVELTGCDIITLRDLEPYLEGNVILKCDIEGMESVIFAENMDTLKTIDYICMEMHYYAALKEQVPELRRFTDAAIDELKQTHEVIRDGVYLYCIKHDS